MPAVCHAGSSRSFDVFSAGPAIYSTAGLQLIASNEGSDLSGKIFAGLRECADKCTERDDCNSFMYNNYMVGICFGCFTWTRIFGVCVCFPKEPKK